MIFTSYVTASFVCCFFMLRANQTSVSCIGIQPASCDKLYWILNGQLFLQPHLVTYREHTLLHYLFNSQLFLRHRRVPYSARSCDSFAHTPRVRTSATSCPTKQRNIQEDWHLQQHRCENDKSRLPSQENFNANRAWANYTRQNCRHHFGGNYLFRCLFPAALWPHMGKGLLDFEVSRSYTSTHYSR